MVKADRASPPENNDALQQHNRAAIRRKGWLSLLLNNAWRQVIFFMGDIKRLNAFPWITWSKHEYLVSYEELMPALSLIKYGDIGLHRDRGYLSNVAIPGFMKHSWIHIQDGIECPQIMEALSEGVVKRSPVYPMHSDYTIILTPRETVDVTDEQRKGACLKAKKIEGKPYDHNFKFDIEEELRYYRGQEPDKAKEHLNTAQEQVQSFDYAFSCTEVVGYAWWHCREELGIFRKNRMGKSVILADTFLNRGWRIKWASQSVTVDAAESMGLYDEESLLLIDEYCRSNPIANGVFSSVAPINLRI
jgi:hypothetical protein